MARKVTPSYPPYVKGVSAGYNARSKRWHDITGRITSMDKALASATATEGGWTQRAAIPSPFSASLEYLELSEMRGNMPTIPLKATADLLLRRMGVKPQTADDMGRNPDLMPSWVRANMDLAEHFWRTEGDCAQVINIPVELLAGRTTENVVRVQCRDRGLRADIEEFLVKSGISAVIPDLLRAERVYGVAYPYEVWSGNDLVGILQICPKFVHVGWNWDTSDSLPAFGLDPAMVDQNATGWTMELAKKYLPPAMYYLSRKDPNDIGPLMGGVGYPISRENMTPIFSRSSAFEWNRYPRPLLSLAMRDLTTRVILEDATRAIIEGHKYQLWAFKPGDADHPPFPNEIKALKAEIGGQSGEASGTLVWRNPLEIEVHVPAGLDKIVGLQLHTELTRSFLRKMGITSRVMSGENPGSLGHTGGGGAASSSELDVTVYLEKARAQAADVLIWVDKIVKKWAKRQRVSEKTLTSLRFSFAPTGVEQMKAVAEIFGPLYEKGAISATALLESVGIDREADLANKKAEKADRDAGLYDPPTSFKQAVEGAETEPPGGGPTAGKKPKTVAPKPDKVVKSRRSPGRPKE